VLNIPPSVDERSRNLSDEVLLIARRGCRGNQVASAEETEETARQARSSCKDDSLPDTSCLLVAALNTSLETTPEMMSAFIARL
jgi:hypothetical protein